MLKESIGIAKYDERCGKIFGGCEKRWVDDMGDLTVILKRLSEAATDLLQRESEI